jgi:hypothetical protein
MDHTFDLYWIQLFVVWARDELAAIELIGFSEKLADRVFCIARQTAIVTACQPVEPHCKTPLRLVCHPSAEKHVAPMAILNLLIKHSATVQRSGGRDIFVG